MCFSPKRMTIHIAVLGSGSVCFATKRNLHCWFFFREEGDVVMRMGWMDVS